MFSTRLGLRMDYEACLAYLLLPPAGGVLLLVLEHRSDYVRFHAWQSSLLFAFIFVSIPLHARGGQRLGNGGEPEAEEAWIGRGNDEGRGA